MVNNEFLACLKVARDIVRKVEGQKSVTAEYWNQSPLYTKFPDWSRAFNLDIV